MPEALRTTAQLASMNHYERLGLASNASVEEITKAYRRLAFRYHPDKKPSEDCRGGFTLINDAYTVLSDPEARRNYDLRLSPGRPSNARSTYSMPSARGVGLAAREREMARARAELFSRMFAKSASRTEGLFPKVTDLQQYLNHLRRLEQEIAAHAKNPNMQDVLSKAKRVVNELHQRVSTDGRGTFTIRHSNRNSSKTLIDLTEVCSRVTQGLHFVAVGGHSFSCELFEANSTGARLHKKSYDAAFHKENSRQLERIAQQLPGHAWQGLRNLLYLLAGTFLVVLVAAVSLFTPTVGYLVAVSSVALLTAGAGFFVGRDTGLARTVHDVNKSLNI